MFLLIASILLLLVAVRLLLVRQRRRGRGGDRGPARIYVIVRSGAKLRLNFDDDEAADQENNPDSMEADSASIDEEEKQ